VIIGGRAWFAELRADSEEALELRDDIGFFQAVKAGLAKQRGERKSSEFLDHAH
jgi:hypothetical protein